jgi:hypothetical protein
MTKWAFLLAISLVLTQRTPKEEPGGSWLDSREEWKWSEAELQRGKRELGNANCEALTQPPVTAAERLLAEAGWMLRDGPSTTNRRTRLEVVEGFRQFDGMCRNIEHQAFVFVNERPIGTLSPRLMHARWDGYLGDVSVSDSGEIKATFLRYSPKDPACCPSRVSAAFYSVTPAENTHVLKLLRVETRALPQP